MASQLCTAWGGACTALLLGGWGFLGRWVGTVGDGQGPPGVGSATRGQVQGWGRGSPDRSVLPRFAVPVPAPHSVSSPPCSGALRSGQGPCRLCPAHPKGRPPPHAPVVGPGTDPGLNTGSLPWTGSALLSPRLLRPPGHSSCATSLRGRAPRPGRWHPSGNGTERQPEVGCGLRLGLDCLRGHCASTFRRYCFVFNYTKFPDFILSYQRHKMPVRSDQKKTPVGSQRGKFQWAWASAGASSECCAACVHRPHSRPERPVPESGPWGSAWMAQRLGL